MRPEEMRQPVGSLGKAVVHHVAGLDDRQGALAREGDVSQHRFALLPGR